MRGKCPYLELFWSAFSRTQTEYVERLRISPYSVRMRENADQNNPEYGHFLRRVIYIYKFHLGKILQVKKYLNQDNNQL